MAARTTKPRTMGVALVALLSGYACGHDATSPRAAGHPPVFAAAPPPSPKIVAADGSYYQTVDANVAVVIPPSDLPLLDERVARPDGAESKWAQAPEALRERVRRNGFAVLSGTGKKKLGDVYAPLRDARVPFVVTMDAMIQIAHIAIDRMLAEAEVKAMSPALATLVGRLASRLDAESAKVNADLGVAYTEARGMLGVARSLADPAYSPARDLEQGLLAPRGALVAGDPQLPAYRMASWLGTSGLAIASRADGERGVGDVYEARTRTRAAMLIARLLQADVDATAADAYAKVARPLTLLRGPSDDLSPAEIVDFARTAKVDVRAPESVQSVTRVDRVRRAAMAGRRARMIDGAAALQMRLLGASATPDGEVFQALSVPALAARPVPSGIDLAAWLGASEARTIVKEVEPDEPAEYDAILTGLLKSKPKEADRHASVVWSGLDALSTYVGASTADGVVPASSTWAWRRHKVEVALGGWATLRHDAIPFTRLPTPPATPRLASKPASPALGFVEPHPEAIAKLIAVVEQTARGLVAMGAIERPAPGTLAGDALDLLRACLAVALREANDEPLEAEQAQAVAEMPGKIANLEARLAPSRGEERALVVDVHEDRGSPARRLHEAIGAVDEVFLVVREPRSGRLVLAVGASLAAHEWMEPEPPLTDTAFRARLQAHPFARAAWTGAYVVGPIAN